MQGAHILNVAVGGNKFKRFNAKPLGRTKAAQGLPTKPIKRSLTRVGLEGAACPDRRAR